MTYLRTLAKSNLHKIEVDLNFFFFFKSFFPHSVKRNFTSCNKLLLLILPQAIIGTLNDGWTLLDSTPFPTSSSIPPWSRLNAPDLPKKSFFPEMLSLEVQYPGT